MNKGATIFFIVFLSILALVLTFGFIFLLTGNFNFNIGMRGLGVGYSDTLVESKEFDEAEEINIKTDVIDVFVEHSETDKIVVEIYSEELQDHKIELVDNKLNVEAKTKNKVSFFFFAKSSKVVVKLPSNYDKKVFVNVETGDINVSDFESADFDIYTRTGDIKVGKLNYIKTDSDTGDVKIDSSKTVDVKSNTGDLRVGTVDYLTVKGRTGDVNVDTINNKVDIQHTTGDVRIERANITEDSYITNTTGDVKISSLVGAYVESSVKTGDTKINNNDRKAEYTINIKTTTGDIRVN